MATVLQRAPERTLGRVAAFDGLRGLAVAAVVLYHFPTHRWLPGGWVGVDVFFVLSGFLITSLLLQEHGREGRIALGRFYARRAWRLLPALGLFLAGWTAALLLFGGARWFWTVPNLPFHHVPSHPVRGGLGGVAAAAGYCINWTAAFHWNRSPIQHLWSLAIEEQFYLVWPVVLGVLVRGRRALAWTLSLATGSAVVCVLLTLTADPSRVGFGTDTRAQGLLIGAAAALAWRSGALDRVPADLQRVLAGTGATLLLATVAWVPDDSLWRYSGGLTIVSLAAAAVVVHLAGGASWSVLAQRPLRYLGSRSYALYLWHFPLATWTAGLGWAGAVAGIALSVAASEASYRLVERRGLARKARPTT